MTIAILLLILMPAIWLAVEIGLVIRDRSRGKGKTGRDNGTRDFNFLAIGLGIALAAILNGIPGFIFPGGKTFPVFLIGFAIMLAGMSLRYWAVAVLGPAFRTTIETDQGQRVVDKGPYKLIRHPSYTGWLLMVCGYGVAVQNWLSLLVAVVLPLAAFLYRIRLEEAALVSAFGPEYVEYQQRTKRLIPRVW